MLNTACLAYLLSEKPRDLDLISYDLESSELHSVWLHEAYVLLEDA